MASSPRSRLPQGIPGSPPQDERSYVGVPATGHVCRPNCPAAQRDGLGVRRYRTLREAQMAGLRPCGRCTPDRVTRQQFALAQAKVTLDEQLPAPDLGSLARAVGMDRSHFQRVFRAAFGMSPKHYALQVRAARFKAILRTSPSVTQALYDAGHNTPRTVYDPVTDRLGMTPLEYRSGGAGLVIRYTFADLPGGRVLVAATERGVCALYVGERGTEEQLLTQLREEFFQAWLMSSASALASHVAALHSQAANRPRPAAQLPRDFHERVWAFLGHLTGSAPTYADLAAQLGLPSEEEAIAEACEVPPMTFPWPRQAVQVRVSGPTVGPAMMRGA
ncbi:helix-turn-helix domain-containing protein (plasmid) [Deinococcus sp. KNUC1210]|uniref:helix-turn-helix domain-containing protein n=1 Tax=Deinococcus sp. KNUC1210 TaxID=2917691 RepID=UPI001EF131D5|nr:helix-turn-helix domain-containing protein [Deinococcus sp. KNUC1210]ULH13961.1 helix-turn-helix domain-containing protein [Deinococcus sp. KNUC1210]